MAGPAGSMTSQSAQSEIDTGASVHVGVPDAKGRRISPWAWVVSANFAEGLQYMIATDLFIVILFLMGIDKGTATFWMSLVQMAWVIKPLWSPLVDRYATKRKWTVWMQGIAGFALLATAAGLMAPTTMLFAGMPVFLAICLVCLFIVAFEGATHDIACDGFYMIALTERQQSFFVGIRSTAYRIAMVVSNGVLLWMASGIQKSTGPVPNDVVVRYVAAQTTPAKDSKISTDDTFKFKFSQPENPAIILEPRNVVVGEDGTASVMMSLAEPLTGSHTKTVLLRYDKGSKGISTPVERFEFTANNWNQPVKIEFKTEKNLKTTTLTSFRASAGNVPLSWAIAVGVCGLFYILCWIYHGFILPYPHAEAVQATDMPPFRVPLGAILVTVMLPIVVAIGIYLAVYYLAGPAIRGSFIGATPTSLQTKGFEFFFNLGIWIVIVGSAAILYLIPPIGEAIRSFFRRMSDISRIGFADVFATFFQKPNVGVILAFLLTFRLGEVQLTKIKNLFLLDSISKGGLEFSQDALGFTNSTVYMFSLIVGGLLGGYLISKVGLKKMIWPMVLTMHIPNLGFVYMSHVIPQDYLLINTLIGIEALFYGFGFTAYMMVMILFAQGPYKTAHYALCTGFMALGAMIPGLWSGYLADLVSYKWFFWIVMVSCIPGMLFIPFLKIDGSFGKKVVAAT